MHLFYTPDIAGQQYILSEEESKHAVRVLRLGKGSALALTDGRGTLYEAVVSDANPKRCTVDIVATTTEYGKRNYNLTMAVALTKNIDRYEWFLEKATEIGCDTFIPLVGEHSERRVLKHERAEKVITSAVKQSLKAYHPVLEPLAGFRDVAARDFGGVKLIAYCGEEYEKKLVRDCVAPGDRVTILVGPEGDFSPEEVKFAVEKGFVPVSLGESRLRTETAAVFAVSYVAFINQ